MAARRMNFRLTATTILNHKMKFTMCSPWNGYVNNTKKAQCSFFFNSSNSAGLGIRKREINSIAA